MLTNALAASSGVANGSSPSWLWYATRGLGTATLILLTASVVLGIGTSRRWEGRATPRFVAADLHRNLSLLCVVLLLGHIVTTILDPFANISVRDAVIPVGAGYRPIWLGLGVAAAEIVVALAVTSMLRARIGARVWRFIHWAAYASWPLSVVHGLGTGSDAQAPWLIGVVAACVAAVGMALARRLLSGRVASVPIRVTAGVAAVATLFLTAAWAVQGPFQPGWSARAGTPPVPTSAPTPIHSGPGGFVDDLAGIMVRDTAGRAQISLRDMVDPELTLTVRPPNSNETLPVLTIARNGRTICTAPASAGQSLYAVCGHTRLTVTLFTAGTKVTGTLTTSGPLG